MMPVRPWWESGNHWPRSSSALSTGCVELTPALLQFMPTPPPSLQPGCLAPRRSLERASASPTANRQTQLIYAGTHTHTHTHTQAHMQFKIHALPVFKRLAWFYTHNTVIKDAAAAAAAKSLQSCPTLCDPIDGSLPGSPVPGILQARTLEWVATAFSTLRMRFR